MFEKLEKNVFRKYGDLVNLIVLFIAKAMCVLTN